MRLRPCLAEINPAVVDAPVIHEPAGRVENSSFGSHCRLSPLYQIVLRVTQSFAWEMILRNVVLNASRCFSGIWIDQPERDASVGELVGEPLEFWGVTVCHRTICPDKQKYTGLRWNRKGIFRIAGQIYGRMIVRGICRAKSCYQERAGRSNFGASPHFSDQKMKFSPPRIARGD